MTLKTTRINDYIHYEALNNGLFVFECYLKVGESINTAIKLFNDGQRDMGNGYGEVPEMGKGTDL